MLAVCSRLSELAQVVGADDGPAGGAELAGAAVEVDTTLVSGESQFRRRCRLSTGGALAAELCVGGVRAAQRCAQVDLARAAAGEKVGDSLSRCCDRAGQLGQESFADVVGERTLEPAAAFTG
jgi:hypothetical protein